MLCVGCSSCGRDDEALCGRSTCQPYSLSLCATDGQRGCLQLFNSALRKGDEGSLLYTFQPHPALMASEWRLALAVYGDGSSTGQFVHTFFNGWADSPCLLLDFCAPQALKYSGCNQAMSRPCGLHPFT